MTGFLVLKDKIVNFYNEHGALVRPVIKFLVTFVAFTLINSHIGYLEILDNQLMLLVAANSTFICTMVINCSCIFRYGDC